MQTCLIGRSVFWTGLGILVSLRQEHLKENPRIFLHKGSERVSASSTYSEQLVGVILNHNHMGEVTLHMQVDQFNPCGIQKGFATYALFHSQIMARMRKQHPYNIPTIIWASLYSLK